MDWIREWILQITAVIILGAVCDMIMTDGEIKKYVKPILGVVLIFTIIRPITTLSGNMLRVDMLQDSISNSFEVTREAEEKQLSHIVSVYQKNLGEKIQETVGKKYNVESSVTVVADNQPGNLGNIESIEAILKVKEGELVNTESIRRYIEEEFGVDRMCIRIRLEERSDD